MAVLFGLVENFSKYSDVLFSRIMEFSVYGLVWLLLLFLAGCMARKKADVFWQYLVSVCIAVHLLVPVHIQWLSVEIPVFQETGQETEPADDKAVERLSGKVESTSSHMTEPENRGDSYVQAQKSVLEKEEVRDFPSSEEWGYHEKGRQVFGIVIIAKMIWIFGMLLFLGKAGISYIIFCRQAKRWSLPACPLSWQILQQIKKEYGIHRNIRLQRSSSVNSPMLYGAFKTVILLPNQEYSSREYQYIFRHELSHYRHGDVWMKYLFTICRGVYWFHPLVHWMYLRACLQMEILCDEAVVGGKDIEEKRAYSMILLQHMSGFSEKVPLTAGFYGGKEYMKMRFKNIMSTTERKTRLGVVLTAVFLVLVLGGVKWNASAGADKKNEIAVEGRKENIPSEKEGISGQTIAVIGIDKWKFADAIFLLHVDADDKEIVIENIPRELLVEEEDLSAVMTEEQKESFKTEEGGFPKAQKLSAVSAVFDYDILDHVLERIYDIDIDSHIVLDYATVRRIVDAVGGVEITLTEKEADYLNHTNFISKKENRTVKAGKQILNGDQAMGYIRVRKVEAGGADVDGKESKRMDIFVRSDRCNNVLLGLAERLRNSKADWKNLVQLVVQEKGIREADIPVDELIFLAGAVVSEEFDVVISKDRTDDDYVEEFHSDTGHCLRLTK